MELLVFYVYLPDKGMRLTKKMLNEIPITKEMRIDFFNRLKEIRNVVVAEIKLTRQEEILVKSKKDSVEVNEE
jgi:hypothetical protein